METSDTIKDTKWQMLILPSLIQWNKPMIDVLLLIIEEIFGLNTGK